MLYESQETTTKIHTNSELCPEKRCQNDVQARFVIFLRISCYFSLPILLLIQNQISLTIEMQPKILENRYGKNVGKSNSLIGALDDDDGSV